MPPAPYASPPPRRTGRTVLIAIIVIVVVGGGAAAGIIVGRRGGGHPSFLSCPAGLCPRFPITKRTVLDAIDPAFGKVRLIVPPGALRSETELSIHGAPADARPPRLVTPAGEVEPTVIGPVIRFGPDGEVFDQPLRVELPFDPARVGDGDEVGAITWNGAQAEVLTPVSVDEAHGVAVVEVAHFSDVAVIIAPKAGVTIAPPPPPPCPEQPRTAAKCPWTPDGYAVGECTPGFCWDGGPQGFLACKQRDAPPGSARGENLNVYCPTGAPVVDRCTGVLTECAAVPAP